jgi:hypothetical protein
MARLTEPWRNTLTKADFDEHPVWLWDDEKDGYLPISESEIPLDDDDDDYGPYFIKARFEVNGHWSDGYLVGDDSFYAFELFIGGQDFPMNLNMPDLIEESLIEICRLMKWEPFELFPLRYESPVRYKGGRVIAGTMTL